MIAVWLPRWPESHSNLLCLQVGQSTLSRRLETSIVRNWLDHKPTIVRFFETASLLPDRILIASIAWIDAMVPMMGPRTPNESQVSDVPGGGGPSSIRQFRQADERGMMVID